MKIIKKAVSLLGLLLLTTTQLFITPYLSAQTADQGDIIKEDSSKESESGKSSDGVIDAADISLESLLDTVIAIASKGEETSFEAPISSTVITKQQIENTGVTSIPEALRLVPGMYVAEQTNGNYDIHIRGFNHLPPNLDMIEAPNAISLVMIDGRPVFNYFSGGTIWETLPIDLNDVERIEVVRGASSALYGPNAASGVINIITTRQKNEGLYAKANIYGGNHSTYIGNASAGYNFGDLSILVSGNYQKRERFNVSYYCFGNENYYADPEDLVIGNGFIPLSFTAKNMDIDELYPEPELALDKKGGNIFLTYQPDDDFKIDLSGGYQSSTAQAALIENSSTTLTFRTSDTYYGHLLVNAYDFSGQFAYFGGKMDTLVGFLDDAWAYDTNIIEGSLEYNYKWKTLILRPGISSRKITYDGEYIAGKHSLTDTALSIRAEYTFFDNLRIISALRGDKYNHPDEPYLSYQFLTTYKSNNENITRASHSRAHKESFILRTYADYRISAGSTIIHINGNPDRDLLTVDVSEIGHRTKLTQNMELDIEIFYTSAKNFSVIENQFEIPGTGGNPDYNNKQYNNAGTKAQQLGSTLTFGIVLGKLQARLFGTIQRTKVEDYMDETGNLKADVDNYEGTPGFYGGYFINYNLISDLDINVNGYYSSQYTFDYKRPRTTGTLDGNVDIGQAIVLNAKVMYTFWRKSNVFVNCRNILNRQERQFVGGDKISLLILGGASIEL